ncbi:MAG: methylmalonyl-CoA mutase family protein, partial [Ilumatobacteraceae bacterium]
QAAYEYTKSIDDDQRVIVGVNKFAVDDDPDPDMLPHDPELERGQRERLAKLRADRNQAEVDAHLTDLRSAARGTQNVLYPMKDALRARATLGEVSDALREVFGTYTP